jgi:hypothetical protein
MQISDVSGYQGGETCHTFQPRVSDWESETATRNHLGLLRRESVKFASLAS